MAKEWFLFLSLISFSAFSQPYDPFVDSKKSFLKMTEENSRIWAKALECGKLAQNNDALLKCEEDLKQERRNFYKKEREENAGKRTSPKP